MVKKGDFSEWCESCVFFENECCPCCNCKPSIFVKKDEDKVK